MRKVLYIFGLLTDADVEWLANAGVRRRVADGEVLIEQQQPTDTILFLLDGKLSVTVAGVGIVAQLGAGEIVGEMSLVDSVLPSATVAAEGGCMILSLNKAVLLQKCEADLGFGCRFYRALAVFLADRLRDMERRLSAPPGESLADGPLQELDIGVLDNISQAGDRFERLLKKLHGER